MTLPGSYSLNTRFICTVSGGRDITRIGVKITFLNYWEAVLSTKQPPPVFDPEEMILTCALRPRLYPEQSRSAAPRRVYYDARTEHMEDMMQIVIPF